MPRVAAERSAWLSLNNPQRVPPVRVPGYLGTSENVTCNQPPVTNPPVQHFFPLQDLNMRKCYFVRILSDIHRVLHHKLETLRPNAEFLAL